MKKIVTIIIATISLFFITFILNLNSPWIGYFPAVLRHTVITYSLPLAYLGNTDAMFNLSVVYQLLDDQEKALLWGKKAAEKGDAGAMYNLGIQYEDMGQLEDSIFWYTSAAKQDHLDAMYNLALLYQNNGQIDNAIEWYTKSAEKGFQDATFNLALLYFNRQEFNRAALWFEVLAEQGDAAAQDMLGQCLLKMDKPEKAVYWLEQSSKQNNLGGIANLLNCYYFGIGTEQDLSRAISLAKTLRGIVSTSNDPVLEQLLQQHGLSKAAYLKNIDKGITVLENQLQERASS